MRTNFFRGARRSFCLTVLLGAFFVVGLVSDASAAQGPKTVDSDLVIPLSDIGPTATFYTVEIRGNVAEFFAVRAPDKSVRLVVNACQSCGPAGYTQDKDTFVCAACGIGFHVSNLEKKQGGCNPIPVGEKNKKIEADRIVLTKDFLEKVTTSRFAKKKVG